jgi:hypothetical protein
MTWLPHVILRVTFEIDGTTHTGLAADNLPPKWFTKDPTRRLEDEVEEMVRVIRAAVRHARAVRGATAFEYWRELYEARRRGPRRKSCRRCSRTLARRLSSGR